MKKIALLLVCFLLLSCHKDDDPVPTCGCDSPTIKMYGIFTPALLKKNSGIFKNNAIATSYYLEITNGAISGSTFLAICNEEKIKDLTVIENVELPISFTGSSKKMCNTPLTIDDSYLVVSLNTILKGGVY